MSRSGLSAYALVLLLGICFPSWSAVQDELMGQTKIEPPGIMTKFKAMIGNADAQTELGMAYATGNGVDKNMVEARQWWEKAAASGNTSAQYALGLLYTKTGYDGVNQDYKTAASWFEKAAKNGDAWAQYSIGFLYENGHGFEKNDKLAGQWYLQSAELGNEYAQLNVGLKFYYGQGTEQNHPDAAKWFRKAAQQGNAVAAYFFGLMFESGQGVQADMDLAAAYLRRAADSDIAAAQTKLGDFYYDGKVGLQQNYTEALRWYGKAAELGDSTAAILIARMYDGGIGTEKDPVKATHWSRAAMKNATKIFKYKYELETFEHFLTRKKIEDAAVKAAKAAKDEEESKKNK